MKNFISQDDIAYALKVKACREEVAMTNEELIKRFLLGGIHRNEASVGFYVDSLFPDPTSCMSLYSKKTHSSITTRVATKLSENYFIITPSDLGLWGLVSDEKRKGLKNSTWRRHAEDVRKMAEQLRLKFVLSPYANADHFQKYMETRINCDLLALANDLRTGSYVSVLKITETDLSKPVFGCIYGTEPCFAVPENYQKLMGNIYTLLEWESILELPKNRISLIDADETQSLWGWLIKENPDVKDRALLRNMYTLSRLMLSGHQEERNGGLIMESNPRR
jgi:hypothetical protein